MLWLGVGVADSDGKMLSDGDGVGDFDGDGFADEARGCGWKVALGDGDAFGFGACKAR